MWELLVQDLWHGHIIISQGIALRWSQRRLFQGHGIALVLVCPSFSFSFWWLLLLVVALLLFFQGGFLIQKLSSVIPFSSTIPFITPLVQSMSGLAPLKKGYPRMILSFPISAIRNLW